MTNTNRRTYKGRIIEIHGISVYVLAGETRQVLKDRHCSSLKEAREWIRANPR